jgi:UDP-glucose:(galactosyl)LPS alpha-1,2-glucosyltransferase
MNLFETPLVIAFTPNYFVPAVTLLSSILKSAHKESAFKVYCLLSENLPKDLIIKLEKLGGDRMIFEYLNLKGQLDDIYIDMRFTEAASYRLLLPNLLPDVKSVIYLDCDIIVRQDLALLFRKTDIESYYLAAVYEAALEHQIHYLESIGCKQGFYFNSGFLIMNLEKLRKDNLVPRLLSTANNPNFQFPDQDALNIECQGRVLGLSPTCNSIRTFYLPQYKVDFLRRYTLEDWDNVQQYGTIHYTGSKPWNSFTIKFEEWWKYFFKLPKDIQKELKINHKMYFLGNFANTWLGNFLLNSIIQGYRFFKYK